MKANQILLSRAIACGLILMPFISLGFAQTRKGSTKAPSKSTAPPAATAEPDAVRCTGFTRWRALKWLFSA